MERQYFVNGRSFLLLLSAVLSGCAHPGPSYLWQAFRGQMALFNQERTLEEVIRDPKTKPELSKKLALIPEIKKFGESQGLKPTPNYRGYVQLDRPFVSYLVSASKELEFVPRIWSFPLVGSFTYVGWFSESDAQKFADTIRSEPGWDVDVRGVSAYSTLGWFKDPVLSSMISESESGLGDLVNVVLHESVHATYYVNGQSTLNESLADFVADELTPLWMANHPRELVAYQEQEKRRLERMAGLKGLFDRLDRLYHSGQAEDQIRAEKTKILESAKEQLKLPRLINNATLIQFKTYSDGKPEWASLFGRCGKSWSKFWGKVNRMKAEFEELPAQSDEFKRLVSSANC